MIVRAAALAALLALPGAARACEVALLFALDTSASVDRTEYGLQRDGLAEALTDPAVVRVVAAAPGGVALAAYEWSGRHQQTVIAPWTPVADAPALAAFADRIRAATRTHEEFPTALGYALGYGAGLMRRAPPCRRQVIDVSGDGVNNDGFGPAAAYREFPFLGVTVNGLAIGGTEPETFAYYRRHIPHGDGAFVETAENFADYARAMRRKLLRELLGAQMVEAR